MIVTVVGGGLMGHGIAQVFALHGYSVRIIDAAPETRAQVQMLMNAALGTLQEAGAAPKGWDAERLASTVRVQAELDVAIAGVDLVIEAINENPKAKRALFADKAQLLAVRDVGLRLHYSV